MSRLAYKRYAYYSPKRLYLLQHGGRVIADVNRNEKGEYVDMWSGEAHEEKRHYLPTFKEDFLVIHKYDKGQLL